MRERERGRRVFWVVEWVWVCASWGVCEYDYSMTPLVFSWEVGCCSVSAVCWRLSTWLECGVGEGRIR